MLFNLIKELNKYIPYDKQEIIDKDIILNFFKNKTNLFTRENETAHFTASSWIVNKNRTKILMVYHNIYDSWSWTGGHADGNENLLEVAICEAIEETGLKKVKVLSNNIFSIEVLTVKNHIKNNKNISQHLHLNITFLLEASDEEILCIKADENSGVKWVDINDVENISKEENMKLIYNKLNKKLKGC